MNVLSNLNVTKNEIQQVKRAQFDTTAPEQSAAPGALYWSPEDLTLSLGTLNGSSLEIGQEIVYPATNQSGATITNGTVVMSAGALGTSGKVKIAPADFSGATPNIKILGVVTHDILNGAVGHVTWFGKVRGLNTTGSTVGETWAEGDQLWGHPSQPGKLTKVQPTAPALKVAVAIVISVHATQGVLLVRMDLGSKLGESDSNVKISSLTNKDVLQYNSTTGVWENAQLPLATTSVDGLMSAADKTKLNGIATGAEVNQNAFSNIQVGSSTISADSKTDTLEIAAGTGITITTDTTNDKITINSVNQYTHPNHTGDVTSIGDGVTTISNNVVTNAKLADMASNTVKGRQSSGTGDPEDISISDLKSMLALNNVTNETQIPLSQKGVANGVAELDANGKVPASITGNADGNAATATKLQTARTISITGDATGSANFDGSDNASINVTLSNSGVTAGTYTKTTVDSKGRVIAGTTLSSSDIPNLDTSKITTGHFDTTRLLEPNYITGGITLSAKSLFDVLRADRTAFLPSDQIIIEQSTDAGATWQDAGVSDTVKKQLFTGRRPSVNIPLKNGEKNTDCMLRITITGMKYNVPGGTAETDKYNYWNSSYVLSTERYFSAMDAWLWVNSLADRIYCKVERATGANPNGWITVREGFMSGWSGGNYIKLDGNTFGGGTTQTSNWWNWRFTFRTATTSNDFDNAKLSSLYKTTSQTIHHIKTTGVNVWVAPNNYMYHDHLYNWDENQNAIFPAQIKGTQLVSTITTGTAPLQVNSTTLVPNLNAERVNGTKIIVGTTSPTSPSVNDIWIDTSS